MTSDSPSSGNASRWPRPLLLVLCAYFALGIVYAVGVPAFEVSDEPLHAAFVQHLADGGNLPIQRPGLSMRQAPWQQEGSQPPLYYAAMALIARPFDRGDFAEVWRFNPHVRSGRADAFDNFNQLVHDPNRSPFAGSQLAYLVLRLIGLCFGACAVASAFHITRLMSDDARAPALAACCVAFNPMFVHIMASVNNDTLAVALASLALLSGAMQIRSGITPRRALILGALLGCAALTKVSGMVVAACVPLAIVLARRKDLTLARLGLFAALIGLPIAAIAGWWYLRNWQLYGDLTGTAMMAAVAGPRLVAPSALALLGEWGGFFKAYWGLFAAVNIVMHEWIYAVLTVALIVSAIGLLLLIRDGRGRTSSITQPAIAALCAAVCAFAMAALVRWTSMTLASQGRLLFPFIAALAGLGALGLLRALTPLRLADAAARAAPFALAALTLAGFVFYIRPAFARPAMLNDASQIPAGYTPMELQYDEAFKWIGYRINTPRQRVGDDRVLDVTLYLQALRPSARDYTVFMRVLSNPVSNPTPLAFYKSLGGGGMNQTSLWRPGEVAVERIRVRLPDDFSLPKPVSATLTPGALAIDVGFIDSDDLHFLETRDGAGQAIGRPAPIVAAFGGAQKSDNSAKVLARFERVELIGADSRVDGQRKTLTLTWRVTQDFGDDYTIFVHAYDGDTRVAVADGPAMNGDFAARWWRAGDVIVDTHTAEIPAGVNPARVAVRVGLYRPEGDFARMPGNDAAGAPLPDFAHVIPPDAR